MITFILDFLKGKSKIKKQQDIEPVFHQKEQKSKTNLEEFLASSKLIDFQHLYPEIDFKQPVEKNQLIKGEKYVMVYIIYCWEDLCYNDHECHLDFGTDIVSFIEFKNDNYEFLYEKNNTVIRIYKDFIEPTEKHTGNFFYPLCETYFIK